jgi:CRISPR-associated protein Csy2
LQRRFSDKLQKGFEGVGIVCHRFEPKVTKPAGRHTGVFHLTRNPVDKDGNPVSFVEEGRAHIEISLVIAMHDFMSGKNGEKFAEDAMHAVQGMRLAGGSILPILAGKRFEAQWWPLAEDIERQNEQFRKLRRRLLPGFALVQRDDLLVEHLNEMRQNNPQTNALDALMDLSRLNFESDLPNPEKPGETMWGIRKKPGWLVPIPIGYAALSPLYAPGEVVNARDNNIPFRFVETLYSLGEWVSPHRMTQIQQLLWHHKTDPDNGIYCCTNHYSNVLASTSETAE